MQRIVYTRDSLVSVAPGSIIAHGCNMQGKMGAGVAAALSTKWPCILQPYRHHLASGKGLGSVNLVEVESGVYVANCITQRFYGKNGVFADADAVFSALKKVIKVASLLDLTVHSSMIGCGYGGLDWTTQVEPTILRIVTELDYFIVIHLP